MLPASSSAVMRHCTVRRCGADRAGRLGERGEPQVGADRHRRVQRIPTAAAASSSRRPRRSCPRWRRRRRLRIAIQSMRCRKLETATEGQPMADQVALIYRRNFLVCCLCQWRIKRQGCPDGVGWATALAGAAAEGLAGSPDRARRAAAAHASRPRPAAGRTPWPPKPPRIGLALGGGARLRPHRDPGAGTAASGPTWWSAPAGSLVAALYASGPAIARAIRLADAMDRPDHRPQPSQGAG